MSGATFALALLSALSAAPAPAPPAAQEEFVGPLAGWKNVQTDYGAKGDGQADDSDAIQKAFDDLQKHERSCVLYFPAGVYRITRTVRTVRKAHHDCMGVTVVGEHPERSVLRWDGPEGGMMVQYDAWYSRISRLTLDGRGKAGVALAYGNAFSTYNETSDMVFRDCGVGMSMATGDNGQAENEVLRCRFLRCSVAGLRTNNFNSMDIWAWYCVFEDCGYGLYNNAGNFHAYQCLFLRSRKADIGTANLMVFSFVNNTSIGSRCFLDFGGGHTWGSPTSITGNRIIEPTGDFAIRLGNGGPYLLADNVIRTRPGQGGPVVLLTWGGQTLVGNTYTVDNAVKKAGRFRVIADKVVDPKTIDPSPPAMPPVPPRVDRKVFEVPAGADAGAIQAAIDKAAALGGQRPLVHLPMGRYKIDRTLTVPPECDVRLVGDGAAETATVLNWAGPPGGAVIDLRGPSHAAVRDLSINPGAGTGIRVADCDQPGGQVFADQLNVSGGGVGLRVDGVARGDVLARCLQGGSGCRKWVQVIGGPRRRAGDSGKDAQGQGSPPRSIAAGGPQVSVFTGATGSADAQYAVSDGGRLLVRSVYHEMSAEAPQGILLNDSGSLTVDSTRFSYKTSATKPLVALEGFRGEFTLLTGLLLPVSSPHTARVEITGDGNHCRVLVMDDLFWVNEPGVTADKVLLNRAKPPAKAALVLCNLNSGTKGAAKTPGGADGFAWLDDRPGADDEFITAMLAALRGGRVWLPGAPKASVTRVRLDRVIVGIGKNGVGVDLLGEGVRP